MGARIRIENDTGTIIGNGTRVQNDYGEAIRMKTVAAIGIVKKTGVEVDEKNYSTSTLAQLRALTILSSHLQESAEQRKAITGIAKNRCVPTAIFVTAPTYNIYSCKSESPNRRKLNTARPRPAAARAAATGARCTRAPRRVNIVNGRGCLILAPAPAASTRTTSP
ncbi:hypothetical protein EVAR_73786_1 [Eumeta japonica]|uniref:Uncharacterized protein n=1 Tax=Eumeta variegata TaxID=151549 RepID=A0A4C2A0M4_EUMVA|nr:hypothetical protein EVAR_73786_1 [Eumeta japonica]